MFTQGHTDWAKSERLQWRKVMIPRGGELRDYRVLEIVDATLLDATYLAEHMPSGRNVTLVEYLPTDYAVRRNGTVRCTDREFEALFSEGRGWFRDAARVLHEIGHPCLPRVPEYFDANGTTYMVIECEAGRPLDTILERAGTLPEAELKRIVMAVADGLKQMHAAGILHWNIAPSRILVREPDAPPMLLHFKWASQKFIHAYHGMTAVTMVEGAPLDFSAPEQFDSDGRHGPWTDIYALAATCCRAMTGRALPESVRRYVKLLRGDADPLPGLAADVPLDAYSKPFREAVDWGLRVFEHERPPDLDRWCAALTAETRPAHVTPRRRPADTAARVPDAGEAESAFLPGYRFRDGKGLPELVVVPAGSFVMGVSASESRRRLMNPDELDTIPTWECDAMDLVNLDGPPHRVTIARPFAVGVYPVTRDEFARFVARTGYSDANYGLDDDRLDMLAPRRDGAPGHALHEYLRKQSTHNWRRPGFSQTGSHPVTHVSWSDAQAYVSWLSRRTGKEYRLLSEAEWEYAARAGATGPIRFGPLHPAPGRVFDMGPTVPAESVPPNAFGVHAVGGCFYAEWTHDCWHRTYVGAPDDGSAWTWEVDDLDAANRVMRACDQRSGCGIGRRMARNTFRVARVLHPPTASPEREEGVRRRYSYPCRIVPDGDGWSVHFPDVPEAVMAARSYDVALDFAEDALVGALAGYVEAHRVLPAAGVPVPGQVVVAVPPLVAAKLALYAVMQRQRISKVELARRLGVSDTIAHRIVDPEHRSHIDQVELALCAVGRTLVVDDARDQP